MTPGSSKYCTGDPRWSYHVRFKTDIILKFNVKHTYLEIFANGRVVDQCFDSNSVKNLLVADSLGTCEDKNGVIWDRGHTWELQKLWWLVNASWQNDFSGNIHGVTLWPRHKLDTRNELLIGFDIQMKVELRCLPLWLSWTEPKRRIEDVLEHSSTRES